MSEAIQQALDEFLLHIKSEASKNITSIKIVITSSGAEINCASTTPEKLKSRGISMRNVFGDFIK